MTHFILTPVGSSGDAHPYLGLGKRLLSRGHQVTLIASGAHQTAAARAGIDFASVSREEDYHAASRNPDLWDPRKGLNVVAELVIKSLEDGWRALEERYIPGESFLVGHPLGFGTRSFEEKTGAPSATLHLAPSSIRTVYGVPALPGGIDISGWPVLLKRAFWALIDKTQVDPGLAPGLNAWRATHDLPPVARIFQGWLNSPQQVIGFFPEWFGPRQPDWPSVFEFASFPLWDDPGRSEIDAELEQFLASGSPPVVATPGSANRHATEFFKSVVGACERSGRRAILLTGFLEQVPASLPPTIISREYLPLSAILPRSSALIHHGGIGTMAQAFASGTPQLVMPMAFDQPDNALRAERAGAGRWIVPQRFNAERVLRALDELGTPAVATAAASIRERLQTVDGLGKTCELLEQRVRKAGERSG